MDEDPKEQEIRIRKAECSNCGDIRKCDIRGSHTVRYNNYHFSAVTRWYLLECRGCEYVFVQTSSTNSDDCVQEYAPDGSGEIITVHTESLKYWPAPSKRATPDWMVGPKIAADINGELNAAMLEVYGALNTDLRMLAAIGIRTAFDVASELLGIETRLPFSEKLDALVEARRIGALDKHRIALLVDAGNASAHRGWRPTAADLTTMMDVLEYFVFDTFVAPALKEKLDKDAAAMQTKVPARVTMAMTKKT